MPELVDESSADAFFRQALAHHRESRDAEARAAYERVLQMEPRHVAALTFLSVIALQANEPERAMQLTARVLEADPENALAHMMQGHAYLKLERRIAALESYERAGALRPDLVEAHLHRGNVQSDLGRGVAQWVVHGESLPPFDYYCPLLSLPLAFGTTPATIPAAVPYLRSSAARSTYWRNKLGERRRPRVGLVWSGGFRPDQPELWAVNDRRNIPLAQMATLLHPLLEFYSLQKGEPAKSELAQSKAKGAIGAELIDFTHELHDFEETAALIEQLDLVISVDTSTAHLAGALGKPLWLLNRFDTCWRWFLDRADTPWYPTARIYRQEQPHDWAAVIHRVREDLMRFAGSSA